MKAKRPTLRKHDRVTLAAHKSVIPPYDGKPFVLRDTVLTVSHLTGTGSARNPWHVVVTDGTHFWHLEPDDVRVEESPARHHATMKKGAAQLDREISSVLSRAPAAVPGSRGPLDKYLQLANHVARWAGPQNVNPPPSLRPYMKRVPRGGDRQFWLGEVLDELRRAAENDLTTAEMKRLDQVMSLISAAPHRTARTAPFWV